LILGGVKTSNLEALADALRGLHPGQTVEVEFARDAAILSSTLLLGDDRDLFSFGISKNLVWRFVCSWQSDSDPDAPRFGPR
jgi:hypothetical protein